MPIISLILGLLLLPGRLLHSAANLFVSILNSKIVIPGYIVFLFFLLLIYQCIAVEAPVMHNKPTTPSGNFQKAIGTDTKIGGDPKGGFCSRSSVRHIEISRSTIMPTFDPTYHKHSAACGRAAPAPTTTQTVMLMPFPGSASAPKTFDGNEEEMADFLEHFIYCAHAAQLLRANRVEFFFRYLSKPLKDFFRGLDGYKDKNWDKFEAAIRKEYKDAFDKEGQHSKRDLLTLVEDAARSPIQTTQQLREYGRNFRGISQFLVQGKVISEEDSAAYFWCGLHEQTRMQLYPKLEKRFPHHPVCDRPYSIAEVIQVGTDVFAIDV